MEFFRTRIYKEMDRQAFHWFDKHPKTSRRPSWRITTGKISKENRRPARAYPIVSDQTPQKTLLHHYWKKFQGKQDSIKKRTPENTSQSPLETSSPKDFVAQLLEKISRKIRGPCKQILRKHIPLLETKSPEGLCFVAMLLQNILRKIDRPYREIRRKRMPSL